MKKKTLPVARALPPLVLLAFAASPAAAALQKVADIADLSLEQLTQVTVTSASRREERVLDAPAAIFVLTAEDIRRSGATTLPDALRLAPNLQVVRGDTSQYVISARGGLAGTANKMLVLIDGRTVYTPLFAGVFWDAQNIHMEDIERIEVISGPGSTLWGTNAVNGVINVITKPAGKTQGALVAAGAGNEERGGSARFGAALPDGGSYRVYAKYFSRDAHQLESGASAHDDADRWQTGFRADWESASRTITVQGDAYSANVDNIGGERPISGGNVLGRWRQRGEGGSELMMQAYYDRTDREHAGSFKERRDTVDFEVQHSLQLSEPHRLVWGGGYRASRDRTEVRPAISFLPGSRTLTLGSLFVQEEWQVNHRLGLTAGLRAERNTYTGLEWLPNLRFSFAATPDHSFWSALTRTVRAPSRIDREAYVPGSAPFVLVGNEQFDSETADVAEFGYRGRFSDRASVSLTAFFHRFRDLRTVDVTASPLVFGNGGSGTTRGIEAWGDLLATRDWRLIWGFMVMRQSPELEPGNVTDTGYDPRRTASIRSLWNVTRNHELDVMVRYVGALANPAVPSYTEVNARVGWRVSRNLELSFLVANALDRKHAEFSTPEIRAVFERTYFLKATWML